MARNSEYSDQQIINAGQDLLDRGTNPTPFAIKQRMGGGNTQRILRVWSEFLGQMPEVATEEELPANLTEAISAIATRQSTVLADFAKQIHGAAVQAANQRLETLTKELSTAKVQHRQAIEDASLLNSELEETIHDLKENAAAQQADLINAKQELAVANEQVKHLTLTKADLLKQLDHALRDAQSTREREATANGQILAMEQTIQDHILVIQQLRTEVRELLIASKK